MWVQGVGMSDSKEVTPASLPVTITVERSEPGVWFFTGDLGTAGPYPTLGHCWSVVGDRVTAHYQAALTGPTEEVDEASVRRHDADLKWLDGSVNDPNKEAHDV